VIGTSVATELDRLGMRSDVIIATLVAEVGLTTAQAREVLQTVRRDARRNGREGSAGGGGSVS
jgi:hypothetical protein